jgi:tRNA threonylcarbamoyladenosine biosynthesis protein TsaE
VTATRGCIFAPQTFVSLERTISSEQELPEAAKQLLEDFPHARVFALHGEMGAGKTTFIKAICRALGVEEVMSSPTFSIVNEYLTKDGTAIYHFDFYRLEDESEAYSAGLHEYFDSDAYCFVEWPERVPSILPSSTVHVHIRTEGEARIIESSLN